MDKNAIKKYAVWARRELISRVTQKALQYGITEKEMQPADASSMNGVVLSAKEKKQRQALIVKIKDEGFEQVMEEVAYTWFNRFSALRFMEVNGYLPTHVRVFTDEENNFKPQILAEAINLEIEGLDMEKVYALKDANDNDTLFKYLIITQCNALSAILPVMFQKIDDYTELLFPDNLLREGSVIEQMIAMIPEEDWQDAVQIIGWLYQYYNAEKKDDVFAALKKNVKITKENIPAATQLFTPDWIVRYMVENSLGRLWLEGHPNEELKSEWKYYLDEAEQEPDVKAQLAKIRKEYEGLKPENIRCIDPCSGSGHILAYLFDVLVQIYEAYGYTAREAAASIVENNLYGLDIDDRAAQLANFAVMMKARQYDKRYLVRKDEDGNPLVPQPHVYAIQESNHIQYDKEYGDFLLSEEHRATLRYLLDVFQDAKEYGSILNVEQHDYAGFLKAWKLLAEGSLENIMMMGWYMAANEKVPVLANQAIALSQKYDAVVTNPPYMADSGMSPILLKFVKDNYAMFKNDLYSCFIEKTKQMLKENRYVGLMTSYTWMFLSAFSKTRKSILDSSGIVTLIQPEYHAFFQEAFVPICTFVLSNRPCRYIGKYINLSQFTGAEAQQAKTLEAISKQKCEYVFSSQQALFNTIPDTPIAYWLKESTINLFLNGSLLSKYADLRQGLITGDNERFLRFWMECDRNSITQDTTDLRKWFFYHKGGEYRKWYGNINLVVNWENDGYEIVNFRDQKGKQRSRPQNIKYYLQEGFTWTALTVADFNVRYMPQGGIFDAKGSSGFSKEKDNLYYFIGLCNSKVAMEFLSFLAPTMDYSAGAVGKIPTIVDKSREDEITALVNQCIIFSQTDWDSFETSWDFKRHPLVRYKTVFEAYAAWEIECADRFNTLKANEEELNRIFIDIYGLKDELTPEVEDKDVTVRKADSQRDIKSLISYAIGCMFGRYSLDAPGLAFAGGGDWDASKYTSFPADKDNIIPICNDGDYFEDDIVGRFVRFIEVVYGKESLKANLQFIADALGGKGQPKDVIRNYFLNDFYSDHCKIYQKRPIYWQFDSGKKNGFKCLIYMHRYQPDTIARIRTDYVHEQQGRYRTAIADLEKRMESASTSDRVKLSKQLAILQAQAAEIHDYEEKIHHLADQYISIDLDDGVKVNYAKFQDVLAKIK